MYRRKKWLQEQNKTKYEKTEDFASAANNRLQSQLLPFFSLKQCKFSYANLDKCSGCVKISTDYVHARERRTIC